MSVLVKGMEMPENCKDCKLRAYSDDYALSYCVFNSYLCWASDEYVPDYLLDSCPLSEIPTPHGRLIDADKLQTAIHGCLCENCQTFPCEKGIGCLIEDVFNLLDEAPTIIEAEVSEE